MLIAIPVSAGELIDKITILEIKSGRIKDKEKLKNINFELNILNLQLKKLFKSDSSKAGKIKKLKEKLLSINRQLWKIEDDIRRYEAKKKFGNEFIKLARCIYILNDERFMVKQKLNLMNDSFIMEQKQYRTQK